MSIGVNHQDGESWDSHRIPEEITKRGDVCCRPGYGGSEVRRDAGTGFINLEESCLRRVDRMKRKAGSGLNSDHVETGQKKKKLAMKTKNQKSEK